MQILHQSDPTKAAAYLNSCFSSLWDSMWSYQAKIDKSEKHWHINKLPASQYYVGRKTDTVYVTVYTPSFYWNMVVVFRKQGQGRWWELTVNADWSNKHNSFAKQISNCSKYREIISNVYKGRNQNTGKLLKWGKTLPMTYFQFCLFF